MDGEMRIGIGYDVHRLVEGRKLVFTVYLRTDAGDSAMYFMGEVGEDGRTMKGTLTIEGMGDATWSAKKQPD